MSTPKEIVNRYLEAFTSGDRERTLALVGDRFTWSGPAQVHVPNRDLFSRVLDHASGGAHGHNLLRQWQDGAEVCSIYEWQVDGPQGPLMVLVSEWDTISDGRVTAARLIFDLKPFQASRPRSATATDPVCGMAVDPANAPERRSHGGEEVAFCSTSCAQIFDADPGRYLAHRRS